MFTCIPSCLRCSRAYLSLIYFFNYNYTAYPVSVKGC